jgi:hypothetical protein
MSITLKDKMKELSPAQRKKVEALIPALVDQLKRNAASKPGEWR